MSAVIDSNDYHIVPDDSWAQRLQSAQQVAATKTANALIEYGRVVYEFQQACESSQGGSLFNAKGREWLGISSTHLYNLARVGARASELSGASGKLPYSTDAVIRIANLDNDAFPQALERLNPSMTNAEVRELVQELGPPRARQKVTRIANVMNESEPDNRSAVALDEKDRIIAKLTAERDEAIVRATTQEREIAELQDTIEEFVIRVDILRKMVDELQPQASDQQKRRAAKVVKDAEKVAKVAAATTLPREPKAKAKLPAEGTYSARDLLN